MIDEASLKGKTQEFSFGHINSVISIRYTHEDAKEEWYIQVWISAGGTIQESLLSGLCQKL